MIKQKYYQIIIHITAWVCFISLPFYFSPKPPDNFHDQPNDYIYLYFILYNLFLMGFYYLNSLVLIPKLLARHKIFYYIISIITIFVIIVILPEMLKPQHDFGGHGDHGRGHGHGHVFNAMGALTFFLIFIISSGITIINKWFATEKHKTLIEKEKLNTELTNLKAQINPHFLFNVLNTIYALALKKSDNTPDAVMRLSKLLRYIVNETQADKVPLEKEIDCINNYIDLQKLRLTDTVEITYNVEGINKETYIAPLLLIAFVENVFKHGVSTHEYSPIFIEIKLENDLFSFKTENKIFKQKEEESVGIGIENTRKRLHLIYPDMHKLCIAEADNTYNVELTINLK